MQLGFDLAIAGTSPLLAPDVTVWGELPQQSDAATTQRTRWEHGHLQTLLTQCPRLLKAGIRQGNLGLVALAADLLVPPLALMVAIWAVTLIAQAVIGFLIGWQIATSVTIVGGLLLFLAIGFAWAKFGRNVISLTKLLAVPLYIAWKIPLYFRFLVQRQTAWIRTERD